jgi:hypothetical protein
MIAKYRDWFCPSGNYKYDRLLQSVTLQVVFMDLVRFSDNSDYFLEQRYPVDLCNGELWCSL